jgi:hypothetical protein
MSFESGSLSFSMFHLPRAFPPDADKRFAAEAAPPLSRLGPDGLRGWVGGRHPLDLPITEENVRFAGYLRLIFLQAARKIPPALFRAHVALDELAWMRAEDKPFVPRRERAEIRRAVQERLLPEMPPQLQAVKWVADETAGFAYADTASPSRLDLVRAHVLRATGVDAFVLTAETAARIRRRVDTRDWPRVSFSADVPAERASDHVGHDFLTWLWFFCEARGGAFTDAEHGTFALALEGPLTFTMEGDGAHEAVLRRGSPLQSVEAKACLTSGKKLRRARLILGRPGETWTCGFDADGFAFRGLKLPVEDPPPIDATSRFQDRMVRLAVFRDVFLRLYDRFVDERADRAQWGRTVEEMRAWALGRSTRR